MRKSRLFILGVGAVFLLVWGLATLVPDTPAESSRGFRNANFRGTYGGFFSGMAPNPATGQVEFTVVSAVLIADGQGGAVGTIYPNPPGTSVVAGPPAGIDPGGGIPFDSPLVVRPDGTGFAEVTFPPNPNVVFNVAFVLADVRDGVAHRVLFNQNTGPFRAGGFLIRQRSLDD